MGGCGAGAADGLLAAPPPHCVHAGEAGLAEVTSLKGTDSVGGGPTLVTLFNLNNMETETPSPKLATMEIMASTYKFERETNTQSITSI